MAMVVPLFPAAVVLLGTTGLITKVFVQLIVWATSSLLTYLLFISSSKVPLQCRVCQSVE